MYPSPGTAAEDRMHMLELNFDELSGQAAVLREDLCSVTKQVLLPCLHRTVHLASASDNTRVG